MPGGSSPSGGFVSGVGAPAYLSIQGYERCLKEYTPTGSTHSQYCLPTKRPFSCNQRSWSQLQNVFKGDCPSQTGRVPSGSSQTGSFVSGVGAPDYLSIPGYELCLKEYTPPGSFHSKYCLPTKRPFSCNQRSWNQLQNVFEGDCPKNVPIGGKKTVSWQFLSALFLQNVNSFLLIGSSQTGRLPERSSQSAGYNYPVPENPLKLPNRGNENY